MNHSGDAFAELFGEPEPPGPTNEEAAPVAAGRGTPEVTCALSSNVYDIFELNSSTDQISLDTLSELQQWVAWREETRSGKPTKVPKNPRTGGNALSNNRATWSTRERAQAAAAKLITNGAHGGIGLQLGEIANDTHRRLAGVDLDSCINPTTGAIAPWAAEIIDRFKSYTEISPSRSGAKIFFVYSAADAESLANAMHEPATGKDRYRVAWSRGSHHEIALDVSHRYYAVTGERLPASPEHLRTVSLSDLRWLIEEAGPAFLDQEQPDSSSTSERPRDDSGSGCAYREMLRLALLGHDKITALNIMRAADPDKQGDDANRAAEWLSRTTDREISRTWANASKAADDRRPIDAQTWFDEEPEEPTQTSLRDPVTTRLNKRHAVVVVRGRTLITTERRDGSVDFGTVGDLHSYYENDRVPADKDKTEPASRRWMRNPKRRSYPDGVTFAPGGCSAGTLNLWRGWAVEPDSAGSCALFLDHIKTIVCRGNTDYAAYALGWMAHMVQHPHEKPGVGLVLRGGKGAGKDTVADYLALMIGRRHAPTVAESDHIVGKFNARLENALLLHVQEGSWAGDRKAEGVLKYLVTSDRIEIERKGIDSINLPSVLRLFISANAEWVVPASPDERRWAVFEVSGVRRGDEGYFTALRAEMDNGGPAALLHYLRSYDLSNFNVRAAPDTEGLANQKLASLRGLERWWFDILDRAELPATWEDDGDWTETAQTIGRDTLRMSYVDFVKARRFDGDIVEERHFGRRLRELLPSLGDARKGGGLRTRQYVLPPLRECRFAFESWINSAIDWT